MTTTAPTYSLADRDRRWARIRAFMDEQGLAGLVVAGLRGREWFESYVSNESLQGAVVFVGSAEPVHLTWSAFRIIGRDDPQNDREYWISDIRSGLIGPGIAQVLTEAGLRSERIGVVGLYSKGPMQLEGFIPYAVWQHVLEALPGADFTDVSLPFSLLMLQKDESELAAARYCASIGERACQEMLEVTRAGVTEAEIFAALTSVVYRAGLTLTPPSIVMRSGRETISWGPPEWGAGAVPPRVIGPGELVYAEMMPTYGAVETQQQMTVAVGPVDDEWRRLADVARRSYDAGLEALKPGVSFVELCDVMAEPVRQAGCWYLSPLIHSVSPACLLGTLHEGAERVFGEQYPWFTTIPPSSDAVLAEGMLFSFEPNACSGRHRVNIGGTVVVGRTGPEELNTIACQMNEVS
jgi:Xaa-Pro aminopeptidase